MEISVNWLDTECRITIHGDIDERGAEELKKCFREIQSNRCHSLIVDFKEVTHIGSSGIGKLLVLYKDLALYGTRLSLVNVPHAIYEILCEMKLNSIFNIREIDK